MCRRRSHRPADERARANVRSRESRSISLRLLCRGQPPSQRPLPRIHPPWRRSATVWLPSSRESSSARRSVPASDRSRTPVRRSARKSGCGARASWPARRSRGVLRASAAHQPAAECRAAEPGTCPLPRRSAGGRRARRSEPRMPPIRRSFRPGSCSDSCSWKQAKTPKRFRIWKPARKRPDEPAVLFALGRAYARRGDGRAALRSDSLTRAKGCPLASAPRTRLAAGEPARQALAAFEAASALNDTCHGSS